MNNEFKYKDVMNVQGLTYDFFLSNLMRIIICWNKKIC